MILSNIEMYKMNEILKIPNLIIISKNELNGKNYDNKDYNFIINLDDNEGSHWVSLFKNKNSSIYFDTYGVLPSESIENYVDDNYTFSDIQFQPINNNSNYCGWFCLLFLYYMNNNDNKDDKIKFNNFLKLFNRNNKSLNKKIIYNYFIDILEYEKNKDNGNNKIKK